MLDVTESRVQADTILSTSEIDGRLRIGQRRPNSELAARTGLDLAADNPGSYGHPKPRSGDLIRLGTSYVISPAVRDRRAVGASVVIFLAHWRSIGPKSECALQRWTVGDMGGFSCSSREKFLQLRTLGGFLGLPLSTLISCTTPGLMRFQAGPS